MTDMPPIVILFLVTNMPPVLILFLVTNMPPVVILFSMTNMPPVVTPGATLSFRVAFEPKDSYIFGSRAKIYV